MIGRTEDAAARSRLIVCRMNDCGVGWMTRAVMGSGIDASGVDDLTVLDVG